MFYKKQNSSSSIFTVCICIIMLGVGFLLGYVFTGYVAGENYKQKEAELRAQIAELEQSNMPASVENDPNESKTSDHETISPSPQEPTPSGEDDDSDGKDEHPSSHTPPDSSPSSSSNPSDIITVLQEDGDEPEDPDSTQSVDSSMDGEIQEKYIFKIYNDKLAIFDYTNEQVGEVLTIINTDINFLSKADRLMLEKGIIIENEEQLARILEDYTS